MIVTIQRASNFDLSVTSRRCPCESFRPPFSKGSANPTRGALVASAEAKLLFAAFLFCQAREALAPPGGVKRSQFSFGPSVSKKKAGNRFKKCLRAKGNSLRLGEVHPLAQRLRGTPHLCGVNFAYGEALPSFATGKGIPSAEPRLGIHPSVALWKDKGVSPSAEGDRRSRRLRRAFEKARAKLSIRHRRDAPINCNL